MAQPNKLKRKKKKKDTLREEAMTETEVKF